MKELCQLFIIFARIGGFTFGGGYAMLPMLQRELVEKHGWTTEEELMDYYAIAQCTPGVIAVNTATLIGRKRKGILGGLAATLGVVFPSFVIISIIAAVLNNFAELPVVKNAFIGIRACVCALILSAVIKLGKKAIVDVPTLLIAVAVFVVMCFLNASPIIIVVCAGLVGLLLKGRPVKPEK
ncbi:MAG: chromate transporter [Ruminococcaceae bacterium]|nr:chromate transporter [Oscillospiraceae bacterium]